MTAIPVDTPRPGRTSPTPEASRRPLVLLVATAMIAAQLMHRAWMTYGGWFHIDDFNFMSRMLVGGPTPTSLMEQYMGHLMPGGMALSWLNAQVAPFGWWLPATELLLFQLLADIGLLTLLVRLFGVRLGILPPLAVYLFTASTVPMAIWWAAGVNQLPMHVALFWGLWAHVGYLQTQRVRSLAAACLWVVVGLMFWEKSILVLGAFGIFTLSYFASGDLGQRLRHTWRHHRAALFTYAGLALLYLGLYLRLALVFDPRRAFEFPLFGVLENMVLRGYLPALLGGPLHWWRIEDQPGSIPSPSDPFIALSVLGLVLLVREIHRVRLRSLRAWFLPGFFMVSNVLLILAARTSYVGELVSLDFRYQSELSGVTAIALGCATLTIRDATESSERRGPSGLLDHPRRVAALMVVVVALGSYSSTQYARHWQADRKPETYVHGVTSTLRAAAFPVPLADRAVPSTLVLGYSYPDNLFSRVFAGEAAHTDFPEVATDDLFLFDDRGRLSRVQITPVRRGLPGPVPGCGYQVDGQGATVNLDGPVAFNDWWVRIGYAATEDSVVTVTAGNETHSAPILLGRHDLFVTSSGAFQEISFSPLAGKAVMCTDDVTVGLAGLASDGAQ